MGHMEQKEVKHEEREVREEYRRWPQVMILDAKAMTGLSCVIFVSSIISDH